MNKLIVILSLSLAVTVNTHSQVISEGFENWTQVVDTFLPDGWHILPSVSTSTHAQRVSSLVEGNYSVRLDNNILGFEGLVSTEIYSQANEYSNRVDISFTYKCEGEGFCEVWLGQALSDTSYGYNKFSVWRVAAGDSLIHSVNIQDVQVVPPFNVFAKIGLAAHPVHTPILTYGISYFTVDNLLISDSITITSVSSAIDEDKWVVVNPVQDVLRVYSSTNQPFNAITVFTANGEIVAEGKNIETLNVSKLNPGFYLVKVSTKQLSVFYKVIKN